MTAASEPYHDGDIVQAHESDLLDGDASAIGGLVAAQTRLQHLCPLTTSSETKRRYLSRSCVMDTTEAETYVVVGCACLFAETVHAVWACHRRDRTACCKRGQHIDWALITRRGVRIKGQGEGGGEVEGVGAEPHCI